MADLKISQLTAISVLTPATDVLPVVDVGGVTKKIQVNQILASNGVASLASATITGDLTVDTSTLKVDSTNNRVGVNNASPSEALDVSGNGFFRGDVSLFSSTGGAVVSKSLIFGSAANTSVASIYGQTNSATAGQLFLATETGGVMTERLGISDTGVFTFQNVGNVAGTAMTLNSTGLGIGDSPSYKLHVSKTTDGTVGYFRRISGTINPALTVYCNETGNTVGFGTDYAGATSPSITFTTGGAERVRVDASGRLLVGKTSGVNKIETVGAGIDGSGNVNVSTVATTIYAIKQVNTPAMCVVSGDDGSSGFCDIVLFLSANAPKVVSSQTMYGTPPARTYTASSSNLQLALASGTQNIRTAVLSTLTT